MWFVIINSRLQFECFVAPHQSFCIYIIPKFLKKIKFLFFHNFKNLSLQGNLAVTLTSQSLYQTLVWINFTIHNHLHDVRREAAQKHNTILILINGNNIGSRHNIPEDKFRQLISILSILTRNSTEQSLVAIRSCCITIVLFVHGRLGEIRTHIVSSYWFLRPARLADCATNR